MQRPVSGAARLQRHLLLGGTFVSAAVGFGVAPYLTFWALAAIALTVRTLSWTTESARERQHLRGRRRWYDAPLTVVSSPWYLVVATAGTLMMLLWASLLAGVAGLAYALIGLPWSAALVVLGAVFTAGLWTGPGSKRLRLPARRFVSVVSRDSWIGWACVGAVAVVAMSLMWALLAGDPVWDPQPGPPWRDGTLLGTLTSWL